MQRQMQPRQVSMGMRTSKLEQARQRVECLVKRLASHRAMSWHGAAWQEVEADCIQRLALAQIELERRERKGSRGRRDVGRGGAERRRMNRNAGSG